jgi:hypothetical protein
MCVIKDALLTVFCIKHKQMFIIILYLICTILHTTVYIFSYMFMHSIGHNFCFPSFSTTWIRKAQRKPNQKRRNGDDFFYIPHMKKKLYRKFLSTHFGECTRCNKFKPK